MAGTASIAWDQAINAASFVKSIYGGTNNGIGSTHTFVMNVDAFNNSLLVVFFSGDNSTGGVDNVTGVTYNSVSMNLLNKTSYIDGKFIYVYYLLSPSTGDNNVIISASGTQFFKAGAATYRNIGALDNSTTSASLVDTNTWTTGLAVANNTIVILFSGQTSIGTPLPPIAGAGSIFRQTNTRNIFEWGLFDSGIVISPAQTYNMTTTASTSDSGIAHIIGSFTSS